MAANNDSGNLSYSLNIDTSKLSMTIDDIEKQLSTINAIASISVKTDTDQLIDAIKKALTSDDLTIKVSLEESFDDIVKRTFSVLESTSSGALEGFLSGMDGGKGSSMKGGAISAVVSGMTTLLSVYLDYRKEQEILQQTTLKSIDKIDNQKSSTNALLDELISLSSVTDAGNTIIERRIELVNQLAKIEPALADSIRQRADNEKALNEVKDDNTKLAGFKAFSKQMATQNSSSMPLITSNLYTELNALSSAEDDLIIAQGKVEEVYGKAYEIFNGSLKTEYSKQISKLNSNTLKQIEDVFQSEKGHALKLDEIYKILKDKKGVSLMEGGMQENMLHQLTGTGGFKETPLNDWKAAFNGLGEAEEEANKVLDEFSTKLKYNLNSNGIDIQKNEATLRNYFLSWKELGKYAQDKIMLNLGINTEEEKPQLHAWQKELKALAGNVIEIKTTTTMSQAISEMQIKYAQAQAMMENVQPILIKAGFDFENMKFPNNVNNPIFEAARINYEASKNDSNIIENASENIGFVLPGQHIPPKPTVPKTDKKLEKLKEEVALFKRVSTIYKESVDLWGEGKALEDALSGYVDLLKKFKLDLEDVKDPEKFYNSIQEKISTNPKWEKALKQQITDEQFDITKKGRQEEGKNIEKDLERAKKAYDMLNQMKGLLSDDASKSYINTFFPAMDLSYNSFQEFFDKMVTDNAEMSEKMKEDLKKKYIDDSKSAFLELLKEFQTVETKTSLIKQKYGDKLKTLADNKGTMSKTAYAEMEKLLKGQMTKELEPLRDVVLEKSAAYKKLFDESIKLSEKEIGYLIEKFKSAIVKAKEGKKVDGFFTIKIDGKEIRATEAELAAFGDKLDKEKKKLEEKNPFKVLLASFNQLQEGLQKKKDTTNEIESLEKYISVTKNTERYDESDILKGSVAEAEAKLGDLEEELKDIDAQNATTWLQMSTRIDLVTKQVTALSNSVVSFFEAFGADEDTTGTFNDIVGIVGGLGDTASGVARMASGDVIGGLTQSIKGIAGVVSSITSIGDRKHEKAIKRLQKAIDDSKIAYEQLGREAIKAFGDAEYAAKKAQISQLKLQQALIQKQIKEEEDKKKTDKDKIKQWEEEYRQLGYEIEDGLTSILEGILGGSVKDFATQLGTALIDAFAAGENAAEAYENKVKEVVGSIMKSVIEQRLIRDTLGKIIDKYVNKWINDEGDFLMTPEQMMQSAANMGNELLDKSEYLAKMLESLPPEVKKWLTGSSELSGLSKGIQSMTEDTAQILEAYLNTIRDVTISIRMTGENQLSVLQASQLIQSQILTEVSMMSSATVSIDRSIRSVIAQSNGDNGAGIRVYIK